MFITLTHRHSSKQIMFNSHRIDAIDPEREGCLIRTGTLAIEVQESYQTVLRLLNANQQMEKNNGKQKSL